MNKKVTPKFLACLETNLLQHDLGGSPCLVMVTARQEAAGQLGRHLQVGGHQGLGCRQPGSVVQINMDTLRLDTLDQRVPGLAGRPPAAVEPRLPSQLRGAGVCYLLLPT